MIAVKLIDFMGDDLRVANAARQSFDVGYEEWSHEPRGPRTRSDRELVLSLAEDGHELPFRHPQVTLYCTAPLPVARQLGKHQVGFSWSETSRRYKTKGITFHTIDWWRSAPPEKRQGSGPVLKAQTQRALRAIQRANIMRCEKDYSVALGKGATPEQARFLLPQSMDVSWTWTGSLLGCAMLYRKRTHPDTQEETRDFAMKVAAQVAHLFPVAWEALTS